MGSRRAQASVIGSILFFVLFAAAMGGVAYYASSQSQANAAANKAQQIVGQRNMESLTYQSSSGQLAISNTGAAGTTVKYIVLKFANGSVYEFTPNTSLGTGSLASIPSLIPSQNCGLSTCLSKYNTILRSTNTGDSIGVVTSMGNVFWEKPALAVSASTPGTTVMMTFSASGASSFGSSPVLTVDGVSYTQVQLPVTTTWFVSTTHSYAWQSLSQGIGTRTGATVTGFAQTVSGSVTATSSGTIAATFTTQYLLTLTGGSGVTVNPTSPTNDWYYAAGTSVQATVPNAWNVVAGQSRNNLISYSLDGSSPTSVTRSGAGNFVYAITMGAPHTLAFNSATQYYLTIAGGNGVSASPASPTGDGFYDSGTSLTAATNYVWNQVSGQSRQNLVSWNLDGGTNTLVTRSNTGTYTTSSITMSTYHTLNLNSALQYYLTLSGGTSTATVGSQTSDGWFDAGTGAQAQSGFSWGTVAGQSRSNLYSYAVDGGTPTQIASRSGSGTYTSPAVTMNTYHTLTFNPVTQYSLTVNGGTNLVYANSPTADGWYDTGTSASVTTNYVWNVVNGQSRQDLLSWNVDGGANVNVARSGSGSITVTVVTTMSTYHAVNFNGVTQYTLNAVGGNGITYTGSITNDGWYDSGSTATATSNYVWSIVAGQSRLSLVSWNLDGGANQPLTRAGSGAFTTTSLTMNTFHTVNFNSVTQYYVTEQNGLPLSGGTGALSMTYSFDSATTIVSQALTDTDFESGAGPWYSNTGIGPCANGAATISTTYAHSPTHSAAFLGVWLCYFQGVSVPSLSSPSYDHIVSATFSGYALCPAGSGCNAEVYSDTNANCLAFASGISPIGSSWTFFSATISNYNCQGGINGVGMLAGLGNNFFMDDVTLSYSYYQHLSSSTSTSPNSYSVSGSTVTYSYGVGYAFPGGSSSTNWSATWPSAESYSSNNCSGGSIFGNTISGNGGPCTLTTTRGGSYSSTIGASQTNDGWYDSGSTVSVSASASGPFAFSSWSSTSGPITSSASASTTATLNGYGTVTANFNVNQ